MKSPTCTGAAAAPGIDPVGAANAPVTALVIAPCPVPCPLIAKMPGPTGPSVNGCAVLDCVPVVTVTVVVVCPATSQGSWKLICPGDTKKSGALIDLPALVVNETDAPSSEVGKGIELATIVSGARFVPNVETIPPGDGDAFGLNEPLTVLFGGRAGGAC